MSRQSKSRSVKTGMEQTSIIRSAPPGRPVGKLHSIPETAEILQTSERTVQRLIASGQLRAHRFRRLVRIGDADIAALLDATRTV
jgi:excisionase family DNA binding protein